VVFARLLIAEGNWAAAQKWLALVYQDAQKSTSIGLLIEILILQAIAHYHSGSHDKAQWAFEDALTMAEPGGYIRIFLNEGEPARALLKQINHRAPVRDYVNILLREFNQPNKEHQMESIAETMLIANNTGRERTLVDPLSERELQVLRYLVTELSTPEIADELIIAVSTVRSHVKSIYSKLGVHNRYQAVESARDLHLT
jgi:LuxR family maltose regulon positive regulatory protein